MTKKKKIVLGLTTVAALVAVFFLGRWTAPTKIKQVEVVKKVEVHHEKQTVREEVDIEKLRNLLQTVAVQQNVRRIVVTEKKPDGSSVTKEEFVDQSRTDTTTVDKTETKESAKIVETREVKVEVEVEKIKTVEKMVPQPQWKITAIGAVPLFDGFTPLRWGGTIERKIVGPIGLGLYGMNTGDVGITLSWSF